MGHPRLPLIEEGRPLCKICNKFVCKRKEKKVSGGFRYTKYCKNCWAKRRKEEGPLPQHTHPPEVMKLRAELGIHSRSKPHRKHLTSSCYSCGFKAICVDQLDVHHRDHNHSNNNPSNLVTLCANCHRLEHYLHKINSL